VFIIPSAEQQQAILRRWKELRPAPPMFMAYSCGQQANSTGAIPTVSHLQEVFPRLEHAKPSMQRLTIVEFPLRSRTDHWTRTEMK
jgi:hypothetical protein